MIALALVLLTLGGVALADDPVVVRVGDFSYTQSQLQGSLDSMLELSEMLRGDAPADEEKAARLQATIDSFVGLGVIENKLTEAGKNDFSEAELEDMKQAANSKYEEFWQLLYQQMPKSGESVEEKDVTETLEAMGYTFDAIYDEYVLQARQNRAIELFVGDIALTQDQVDAYYEEQFVGPDREDYKDDLEKYESEILANDNESFYTPEGYRYMGVGEWMNALLKDDEPVVETAKITRTNAAGSLSSRLQMASGLYDDADAQVTVYSDNEVVIQLQAESGGTLVPVDGATVKVRDALDPNSQWEDCPYKNGTVLVSINKLTADKYDVYHLGVDGRRL